MEGDLQFYYNIDLRDLWRPGGGASRLTYRRLLVLVGRLPQDSAFMSACKDSFPVSPETAALYRLEEILTRQRSPMWDAKKRLRDKAEHEAALLRHRGRAASHNRKFLEARRKARTSG